MATAAAAADCDVSNSAAADNSAQDSGSESEEDYNADSYVRCPVCLDYFNNPKLLPCGHVVCDHCLLNWLQAQTSPLTCPVCRGDVTEEDFCRLPASLSPEEICQALPNDSSMEVLVDAHRQTHAPHLCMKCNNEANSFCLVCYIKLCRECRRKHAKATNKRMAKANAKREAAIAKAGTDKLGLDEDHPHIPYVAPKKHDIQLLAQLTPKVIFSRHVSMCTTHTAGFNLYDYYCNTHDLALCLECLRESHLQCEIITYEEKVTESKKELKKVQDLMELKEQQMMDETDRLTEIEEEAQRKTDIFRLDIDTTMNDILQRLQEARTKLSTDLGACESMSRVDKVRHQALLLHSFKDHITSIVTQDEAQVKDAVQRYADFSRDSVQQIQARTDQGLNRQRSCTHSACPPSCPHNPNHLALHQENLFRQVQEQNSADLHSLLADMNGAVNRLAINLGGPLATMDDDRDETIADTNDNDNGDNNAENPTVVHRRIDDID